MEDSPQVHEAEPKEQHEGRQDEPAVDELRRHREAVRGRPPVARRDNTTYSCRTQTQSSVSDWTVCVYVREMPAVSAGFHGNAHLVTAVLVQDDQEDCHDHDDADHDNGVEDGVKEATANRWRVLAKWRVNPAWTEVRVSCGRSSGWVAAERGPTAAGRSSLSRS